MTYSRLDYLRQFKNRAARLETFVREHYLFPESLLQREIELVKETLDKIAKG